MKLPLLERLQSSRARSTLLIACALGVGCTRSYVIDDTLLQQVRARTLAERSRIAVAVTSPDGRRTAIRADTLLTGPREAVSRGRQRVRARHRVAFVGVGAPLGAVGLAAAAPCAGYRASWQSSGDNAIGAVLLDTCLGLGLFHAVPGGALLILGLLASPEDIGDRPILLGPADGAERDDD